MQDRIDGPVDAGLAQQSLAALIGQVNRRIEQIADEIQASQADLPHVRRLSGGAFVANAASLGASWTAFHHDAPAQARRMAHWVRQGALTHVEQALDGASVQGERFSPVFIERVRPLLAEYLAAMRQAPIAHRAPATHLATRNRMRP